MWQFDTPCQQRPEEFTPRRGGETYEDCVTRLDVARMICETSCKHTKECEDYATRVAVTGVCAGSLYEEGVRLEWPKARLFTPKRKSLCCFECDEPYTDQKNNPLCPVCRRKAKLFWAGEEGEASGDTPSRLGRQAYSEAA